jgi:hypothetical protein
MWRHYLETDRLCQRVDPFWNQFQSQPVKRPRTHGEVAPATSKDALN